MGLDTKFLNSDIKQLFFMQVRSETPAAIASVLERL